MKELPYGKQWITEDDRDAVSAALKGDLITRGPKVEEFENGIAQYCEAKYCVAFSSGTSALQAAANAASIGVYDKVFTTPNSFIASIGPSIQRKATPSFIDIDLQTGNLDLDLLKEQLDLPLSRGKKVIIPVHFGGIAMDLFKMERLLNFPDSLIIEDAAHALGSCYPDGRKVGNCAYSAMTIFSFHPLKAITTGEGGAVTTNDEEFVQKLKRFRDNGIERGALGKYEVKELTGNFHLTEMQAALGLSQLKRLDQIASKRRSLVKAYRELLKDLEGIKLFVDHGDRTAYHLFVVQIDFESYKTSREEVMQKLLEKGINTQVHYIPLYRHPAIGKDLSQECPQMEKYYSQALTLPLFYEMETQDVERVVDTLVNILKNKG